MFVGLNERGELAIFIGGLSKQRQNRTFSDLVLDEELSKRGVSARCALQVINLKRGDVVHELRMEGVIEEPFDTEIIPGARNFGVLGFVSDEIRRTLS